MGQIKDYERLEFFGDTVLKFLVTVDQVLLEGHLGEGVLTLSRAENYVSNKRLM